MKRHAEIVGAGFAGLVAGAALAQRGWTVQVHERGDDLRAFGAGIFIWENGLRVLREIGAYEEAIARSHEAPDYLVRGPNNEVVGRDVFGAQVGTRMLTMTRQALYSAVLNAAIESGVKTRVASHVVSTESHGVVHTEDGKSFSADLVVGADGVNSRVRDSLQLLTERTKEGFGAIRLLVDRNADDEASVVAYQSKGPRRTLYVPCDRETLYLCFTMAADDEKGQRLPFNAKEWGRSFPHLRSLYQRIGNQGRWDLFETIELSAWFKGSVAVIGDAAHGMTPALGQGAGCAMMNALSLAQSVSGASDVPAALAVWEREERPLTKHTQIFARNLTNGSMPASASGTKWTADALRAARHQPLRPTPS